MGDRVLITFRALDIQDFPVTGLSLGQIA